eukprot:scaffold78945_cov14-Prasinocladus_malaysianus.AAC.1
MAALHCVLLEQWTAFAVHFIVHRNLHGFLIEKVTKSLSVQSGNRDQIGCNSPGRSKTTNNRKRHNQKAF